MSAGILEMLVKDVVVGEGVRATIELDCDPDVESGRFEVREIGLELVLGILGPELSSLDIKGLGEMEIFHPSRWAPNMSVSKVETLKAIANITFR